MPTDPTPDPALVALAAETLGARRNGLASDGRGWFRTAADRVDCYADATAVLAALATEGRLLPATLDDDALLELATPLLAEALPMPPEQAVITALGRRIKAEVMRIHAAGVADGRKQAAADTRGDAHHLRQETTP